MDGTKILLHNLPKSFDEDTIRLLFENPKYCGKCDVDYDIVSLKQSNHENGNNFITIEYSSPKCVEVVLKTGEIKYKEFIIRPIAYSEKLFQRIDEQIKLEQDSMNSPDMRNIAEEKLLISSSDHIQENQTSFTFKHQLPQYIYPYYLLNYNENIVNDLNNKLRESSTAQLIQTIDGSFLIEAKFSKKNVQQTRNIQNTYQIWLNNLTSFLDQFFSKCFNQLQIPTQKDRNLFNYLRKKAVDSYSESNEISLIYNNDPNNYWIRIEGEAKFVEVQKNELLKAIEFYNKNKNVLL